MSPAVRALLAAAAAASLVAAVIAGTEDPYDPDIYDPDRQYVTKLQKGPDNMFTTHGPGTIAYGQCSHDFDDMLHCDNGVPPEGVRVSVEDFEPFPVINIANSLRHARVQRAEPCRGEAVVRVQLSCSFP
ncbi:uncharacterized protein [Epargyreus clarus]|uniref:uncharacterized protein n=1 Tax=Epargyreus clarus TaxID=520877 RepID=UPI003C2E58B0